MKEKLESLATGFLIASAAIVLVIVISRELKSRELEKTVGLGPSRRQGLSFDSTFTESLKAGRRSGDSLAPVQLVEYFDLECPACKRYHAQTLALVRSRLGAKMATTFVHFPLSIHRLAPMAARAAECAAPSGQFENFVEHAYSLQDSLGLLSWTVMASRAGVSDTLAFARCLSNSKPSPLIAAGIAQGRRLELTGTPTVILNGWRFAIPPSEREIADVAEDLLAGRRPNLRNAREP